MMNMQVVAQAVDGVHIGANTYIEAVSTDSRRIREGDLFVALRGNRFDGHQYVNEAAHAGAKGVLVDESADVSVAQVVVGDTELALGRLASHWRQKFSIPLVAVTGSNGKTTVKEMIGSILSEHSETLVSHGNFNNAIGLPLSLLKLRQLHQFAVVEIGMNQIGEIEYLSKLACPDVVVITNASSAHLQYLKNLDQVAIEKGSLMVGLSDDGIAILNVDDEQVNYWKSIADRHRVITFGLSEAADVKAVYQHLEFGSILKITTPRGIIQMELKLAGVHNILNALAATAAAIGLGISDSHIKSGLEKMSPVAGRLQLRQHKRGGRLLDDTYNANPASVAAALNVLKKLSGDRRLVIGDMFELGENDAEFHREIGKLARQSGIGRVYALGNLTKYAVKEFGYGAQHFQDRQELVDDLLQQMDSNTIILVKGSRGMKMESIVNELCAVDVEQTEGAAC